MLPVDRIYSFKGWMMDELEMIWKETDVTGVSIPAFGWMERKQRKASVRIAGASCKI
jgi:hypothetical protein